MPTPNLYNQNIFSDKTHQEKLNYIDAIIKWNTTGSFDYTEELFNYCTIYQKNTLIDIKNKNNKPLKPFELDYIRISKIDIITS